MSIKGFLSTVVFLWIGGSVISDAVSVVSGGMAIHADDCKINGCPTNSGVVVDIQSSNIAFTHRSLVPQVGTEPVESTTHASGSISGTVLDPTGASVPGATVTVTQLDTGRHTTVTTNSAGNYVFPSLVPAHYKVKVTAAGFQSFEESNVVLEAKQSLSVGAKLNVSVRTDTIQVHAVTPASYAAPDSNSATRADTPLIEVPQSVQVITGALIVAQDARTLADALVNVSGVTPTKPEEALFVAPIVRGFPAEIYQDELPIYGMNATSDPTSLVGAKRIEVVKGPTSTMYGGGVGAPLGGLINVVSKRPEAKAHGSVAFRTGSFSTLDPYVDLNVPLGPRFDARVTGEYQSNGSWIDGIEAHRWSAQPSLLFRPAPDTELLAQGQYNQRSQFEYSGLPADQALADHLDRYAFPGTTTGQPRTTIDNRLATVELRHRFTDDLRLTVTGRYYDSSSREYGSFAYPVLLAPDPATPTTYPIFTIYLPTKVKESTVDANLLGTLRALGGRHELLGGVNYDHTNFEGDLGFDGVPVGVLDLARPNYRIAFGATPAVTTFQTNRYETIAAYLQDQATYGRLHLLGSLRLTRFKLRQVEQGVDSKYLRWTPRLGATFDLAHGVALYAAYATGFRGAANFIGLEPPKPETSRNAEVGLKLALPHAGLSGTIAAFEQTRRNVTTVDPHNPLYSIQTGEERARGVEADLIWEPMRAFSLVSNYAYTGAEVVQDTTIPIGDKLPRVPQHSGRVLALYRVQNRLAKGLSFSAGITAFSRREIYLPNTMSTPGYAVLDAHATYEFGRYTIEGSAFNLGNRHTFDPYAYLSPVVIPIQPRSAYVGLKVHF